MVEVEAFDDVDVFVLFGACLSVVGDDEGDGEVVVFCQFCGEVVEVDFGAADGAFGVGVKEGVGLWGDEADADGVMGLGHRLSLRASMAFWKQASYCAAIFGQSNCCARSRASWASCCRRVLLLMSRSSFWRILVGFFGGTSSPACPMTSGQPPALEEMTAMRAAIASSSTVGKFSAWEGKMKMAPVW